MHGGRFSPDDEWVATEETAEIFAEAEAEAGLLGTFGLMDGIFVALGLVTAFKVGCGFGRDE